MRTISRNFFSTSIRAPVDQERVKSLLRGKQGREELKWVGRAESGKERFHATLVLTGRQAMAGVGQGASWRGMKDRRCPVRRLQGWEC
ncbi:MAG TPA: hypothetical protein VHY22_16725, partial [Chthoniobacteraceae bacterium]|nr:hypothetical protein [Chthoniobacteraceae bacterium]